ncbi:ArsR family transcriptional regulator [Halosimplex carlsbadense 2-9-1]|uniref:ArsR family transcriptional regulator n=1 Tax=Halosimplex carlsbadense 2-9-1 TaxID=797114 RepID=M0CDX7_9EURY|nr:helix-turn-helix domain-containing protein [Halosimplex carlsbadense]ELZ20552.1 ArsR family transcriptional regulator [Halosimplex carlsbadense 2-9-1]
MSHLLPRTPRVERPDAEPEVVGLDGVESGAVFSVLSSERARSILSELYREPATQSELADRVDTSLQNADYHLDNLVEAGLVTVVDQWYSEKGTEMDVYAPASGPLVVVAGGGGLLDDARRAVADADAVEAASDRAE